MSTVEFKFISRLEDPLPFDEDLATGDRVDTALEKLQGQINFLRDDSFAQNRFPSRDDSIISFTDSSRTFSIRPSGSTYKVFINNRSIIKTTIESIQIPNITGLHYIYFDRFSRSLTTTQIFTDDIFLTQTLISVVYWRADIQKRIYFADERHGSSMDPVTHLHFHQAFGCKYISGLDLQNLLVDGDGSSNDHAKIGIQNGIIRDEDLKIEIVNQFPQVLTPFADLTVMYRTGNNIWNRSSVSNYPLFVQPGQSLPSYNYKNSGNWIIAETPNNSCILVHVIATNDVEFPVTIIMGGNYANAKLARDNAIKEFSQLDGLPFLEFVAIATLVFQVRTSFTNDVKSRIISINETEEYIDWRRQTPFSIETGSTTSSANAAVPTYIQPDDTYIVEADTQVLFRKRIKLGSGARIKLNGILVGV